MDQVGFDAAVRRRAARVDQSVILPAQAAVRIDPADRPRVKVTAHRGHSAAAPENTRSAVRKAIASGADYAEVDVQLTADGAVVLLHDRDLKRVAGDPRRLSELSSDEVRKLGTAARDVCPQNMAVTPPNRLEPARAGP